jgi:hypothetical protein
MTSELTVDKEALTMKCFLLISCIVLCSCFSEKEAEPENSSSSFAESSNSQEKTELVPCSSSSVEPDPLILDCPPEDIAECPVSGHYPWLLRLSVEELSFGSKGGIRCITTSEPYYMHGMAGQGCRTEFEIISDTINIPPTFVNVNRIKKLVCPWFTVIRASERVIYILVGKNETENERKMFMYVSTGDNHAGFTIIQSAE